MSEFVEYEDDHSHAQENDSNFITMEEEEAIEVNDVYDHQVTAGEEDEDLNGYDYMQVDFCPPSTLFVEEEGEEERFLP
jgi:hypothetical protein